MPGRHGVARHPHPGGGERVAVRGEYRLGRPVGAHPAAGLQHDHPVDKRQRLGDPVLDEDQRGVRVEGVRDGPADQVGAGRVEVGGRLVEQQEPRPQRERPGQGEPLLFAAGERRRGPVPVIREADPAQRLVHPGPDLVGGHAPVLQPERDVVAAAGHHQLGLRVLEDDADAFPGLTRVEPVDLDGALLLAGVLGQQPGQRRQQRALARPGGAQQQHPLPGLDAQVHPPHRPALPPRMPPPKPPQLNGTHAPTSSHPVIMKLLP
ncbi:hypothetical protein B0E53_05584 [Micromonospora sp. MH33]|nr:hypothetical protein B0E53_05584 [Micromonospora sp. MH33]